VDTSLKGQTLFELSRMVDGGKVEELAEAIDSPTAAETATLVPFFGPSLRGEAFVRDRLAIDTSRALLAGISYEWHRPFEIGEVVDVRLFVEDIYEKSDTQFAVVSTEFRDAAGALIQQQRATFIERGAS
jgi:hypothetical protein